MKSKKDYCGIGYQAYYMSYTLILYDVIARYKQAVHVRLIRYNGANPLLVPHKLGELHAITPFDFNIKGLIARLYHKHDIG